MTLTHCVLEPTQCIVWATKLHGNVPTVLVSRFSSLYDQSVFADADKLSFKVIQFLPVSRIQTVRKHVMSVA